MEDGIWQRLHRKALSNQLAIAVGSAVSPREYSIPVLAEGIARRFGVRFRVRRPDEFWQRWNDFVKQAEVTVKREVLVRFVRDRVLGARPTRLHQKVAALGISNFIDTTFDRLLCSAMVSHGKTPLLHDWHTARWIGSWRQTDPDNPTVFFMLPNVTSEISVLGIYEQTGLSRQDRIQVVNIAEMLSGKDLLLIDFRAGEAEHVLHLSEFVSSADKVVNRVAHVDDQGYWLGLGVCISQGEPEKLVDFLLPRLGGRHSAFDMQVPRRMLIDVARGKQYDGFISYYSGDKEFTQRLARDLTLRGLHVWIDAREIDVGDSISARIQEGLTDSYTFLIVLSPEALGRPIVNEELRAAYHLRAAGKFKILPILHKECVIPPFLADYRYADFREAQRYEEQLGLLERGIRRAVEEARGKR